MKFHIICPKNKAFWSKFATIMASFCAVLVAVVTVFP